MRRLSLAALLTLAVAGAYAQAPPALDCNQPVDITFSAESPGNARSASWYHDS